MKFFFNSPGRQGLGGGRGAVGERVADGEVSLGGDGHRHEDGGRQHDVLRRVEQPGEGVRVQATGVNLGGKREKECLFSILVRKVEPASCERKRRNLE